MHAIHASHPSPLIWHAGSRAQAQIGQRGLQAADIGLLPGAAGGPKALSLTGLDQAIFGDWLPQAPRMRHLIGSSIGAWRFACAMQADSRQALGDLAERYTAETYAKKVTAAQVAQACRNMIGDLLPAGTDSLLQHPQYNLTMTTVRGRGPLGSVSRGPQLAGVIAIACANLLSRRLYASGWRRVWFSDPRQPLPDLTSDFPTRIVPLTGDNLLDAPHATAAIPLVVEGVSDPRHAPPGHYLDGGLMDYHLDLPYQRPDDLVLYPHFYSYVVPGWFDKRLPWRRAHPSRLENVVLVAPSPEWVARLPHGKIPDRGDFTRFDAATRQRYWRQVRSETDRLVEAFLRAVEDGGSALPGVMRPF